MLSIGHLNCENTTDMFLHQGYGNLIKQLRGYDTPGIDVIWGQISYPDKNGKCCTEGHEFFPRVAYSAAAHQGRNIALSESFAVYSEKTDFEEMRFVVGYQAVRGINLFNFMAISFDTTSPVSFQFRPNFNINNPSKKHLLQINDYTARLSYILQDGKPRTKTALYYPFRSLAAGEDVKMQVMEDFERIRHLLESRDISFDLIDDEFVSSATVKDGVLIGEHISYENVIVPFAPYKKDEIKEKLLLCSFEYEKNENSCGIRTRVIDNSEKTYLLVFNEQNNTVNTEIKFADKRRIYSVDLLTGKVYIPKYKFDGSVYTVALSLSRGECNIFIFTDEKTEALPLPEYKKLSELKDFDESKVFRYKLDMENGPHIEKFEISYKKSTFERWPSDFSGQYIYRTVADKDYGENLVIDLGKINCVCEAYLNGDSLGAILMPPYRFALTHFNKGDELKIFITNTSAREMATADYFDKAPEELQGSYSPDLLKIEKTAEYCGLYGPIYLYKQI